ncbi:MAG TPA: hypothetical protein VG502_02380 [Flexivirga sp.]|uniref:hypothetical protein n=1 Tax=Flexivirga sp. TaxID=1962927 RepID=UPI002B74A4ED|nr:hypothetical protein [Flexivirga sp.]HWC21124.1 hypothetical protein [Flexivirga sp.]
MEPLPKYWRSAQKGLISAWGWSTQSADEALAVANERLAHSLKVIHHGLARDRRGSYGWAPPREETLREIVDSDGALAAVVSRNRYGADVLGTDRLLIADVDVANVHKVHRSLRKLFGGRKTGDEDNDPKVQALRVIQDFAAAHPALGVRAYETFGGFRVIVTGSRLEPKSPEAVALFEQLGTDQIYVHLCRKYNTCRARLTPKPWRCGLRAPKHVWPPDSADEGAAAARWLSEYQAATAGYATCRLRGTYGVPPDALEAQLINVHDRATRVTQSDLPLA